MASTVIATKAALISLITGAVPSDVVVSWGLPDFEPDDMVVVQGASGTVTPGAMGSTRPRDEQYALTTTISVYRGGSDQQVVTTRTMYLFDLIEAALRSSPTLGGAVMSAVLTGFSLEEASAVDNGLVTGRVCEAILSISIRARI